MASRRGSTVEMQRVDCARSDCSTRYASNDTRSQFEAWLRRCGWTFRPVIGWICPDCSSKEQTT